MTEENQKLKDVLEKTLAANLSDEERGRIYANFALLYLKTINKLNKDYEVVLDGAIAALKDLSNQEKELAAKISQVSR